MDKLEMNIVYEEEPSHPCFHIDVSVPYEEDYQIRMLKNNEIPGILKVSGFGGAGESARDVNLGNNDKDDGDEERDIG